MISSRRSFLSTLATAIFGAPLVASATLRRAPWEPTREERLALMIERMETDPDRNLICLRWTARPDLYESYSICRLPAGVTQAEVLSKADPTVGYLAISTCSSACSGYWLDASKAPRGSEYLVVGVGYDGYTTPIHHVQSPVTH